MDYRSGSDKMKKFFKYKKRLQILIIGAVLLLQVILIIACGANKVSYHMDEYSTYILANSAYEEIEPKVQEGVAYQGDAVFNDYLVAQDGHRFDYSIVWYNQSKDVHPPFYYVLIHTVCSFFPGIFSKWFGISVNIFFFILCGIFVYKILKKLYKDNVKALIGLLIWGTLPGIINTAIFIRMYMMMSFFVLAAIYIHLQVYTKEKLKWNFYVPLFFVTVGGALTHYYFVVFIFFTALFYGIRFCIQKRWRDVIFYIITYLASAVTALLIFPSMIEQVFFGYRGEQAFTAMGEESGFLNKLIESGQILINNIAGNVWIFCLILIAATAIIAAAFRKKSFMTGLRKILNSPVFAMLVISVLYFFLIVRIAPYVVDRYIAPVFGLLFIAMYSILWKLCEMLKITQKQSYLAVLICSAVISGVSWTHGLSNLWLESLESIDIAEENSSRDVLIVYEGRAKYLCPNLPELVKYHSYTVVREGDLEEYITGKDLDGMVLYIFNSMDRDTIFEEIQTADNDIKTIEKLYKSYGTYMSAYLLSSE